MKIVFMGTPDYADRILKSLLDDGAIDVVAVFTQPDRPVGRKKVLTPPPVKVTAREAGVDLFQPDSLRDDAMADTLAAYVPDFIVVAAYGQILPKTILDIAPCINLHASLLPKYRGASPIQEALLHGDKMTGVTTMLMEEGLDSGPVLAWDVVPILPTERKEALFEKLGERAAAITPQVLKRFVTLRPLPQCDADATWCRKITRADGRISFDMDAQTIYNRFRAFEGWPGIYLENGLKLLEVGPAEGEGGPGRIVAIEEDGIVVACRRGALKISKLQPPSKKAMDALSYIRGRRLSVDDPLL